jgi:hypothetical protein
MSDIFESFNKGNKKKKDDEWDEINREYKRGQPQRNRNRLAILEEEQRALQKKGIVDKSLMGDIEHQKKSMDSFDFPSEGGLDVSLKGVEEEVMGNTPTSTPTKKGRGFPLYLLDEDFKKQLGFDEM